MRSFTSTVTAKTIDRGDDVGFNPDVERPRDLTTGEDDFADDVLRELKARLPETARQDLTSLSLVFVGPPDHAWYIAYEAGFEITDLVLEGSLRLEYISTPAPAASATSLVTDLAVGFYNAANEHDETAARLRSFGDLFGPSLRSIPA